VLAVAAQNPVTAEKSALRGQTKCLNATKHGFGRRSRKWSVKTLGNETPVGHRSNAGCARELDEGQISNLNAKARKAVKLEHVAVL
jgi:hypothetical protein